MKEKILKFIESKIQEVSKYIDEPIFGLETKLKLKGSWAAMLQIKEYIESLEGEE